MRLASLLYVPLRTKIGDILIAVPPRANKAAKIKPRPTAKVKENGYNGYVKFIEADIKTKYLYDRNSEFAVADAGELQLLINGAHSALDIKKMLDAQNEKPSSLQGILNAIEVLKFAGLVEY
jgi:hypothetical protein